MYLSAYGQLEVERAETEREARNGTPGLIRRPLVLVLVLVSGRESK